jgi:pre-rRNA-processing protein TSR4
MDPYDSDSSGLEDEGDYTETGVLLGFASPEETDDTISHLGGRPVCSEYMKIINYSCAPY